MKQVLGLNRGKKITTSVRPERCKTVDTAGCRLNRQRLLVMNMCCTGIKGYFILQGARTIIDTHLIILNICINCIKKSVSCLSCKEGFS